MRRYICLIGREEPNQHQNLATSASYTYAMGGGGEQRGSVKIEPRASYGCDRINRTLLV